MKKVFKKEPLISVIVPIYNGEKYLKECIESIINQIYINLEIVLVNDGSTDNSGKICDEYAKKDKRIRVMHKSNSGVSSSRNIGLDIAKGDYVTFIDADDYISNDYCAKMLKAIIAEDVDCVACGYNKVYKKTQEKVTVEKNYLLSKNEVLEKILFVQEGLGFCHTKLWKRQIIDNVRFNEKLVVGEDALFCLQICQNLNKMYILNEPLYNYRFNSESVVRKYDKKYAEKYLKSMRFTKSYLEDQYKNNNDILFKVNNYISYHVLLIAVNYCFHPNNNLNFIDQIKEMKKISNIKEFKNAIKHSIYKGFSLTRKITLFTLKHKLYFLTMIIGKIRQIQFK